MGAGGVGTAVSDAGPLIHLNETGCLRFLRIFDALPVPDAVWAEATQQGRVQPDDILSLGNVERRDVDRQAALHLANTNQLENLHPADCDCLLLCHDSGTKLLLTDDLALWEAAQRLGLRPAGSLGIIVRAHREGLVSLEGAEAHLQALHASSTLFVTPAIVELAIEQLRTVGEKR